MPRQKDVTMKKLDPKALHEHAIARAVKLHSPYDIVASELVGEDPGDYAIVYVAPLGGERHLAAIRSTKANAIKLRDLLADAWARGKWSAGRE